ncbi:MAG: response regulator [Myxococcota bacterium]|jgi:PAS domain S-box-containing protein|nr:response regulator [Myxococcota bacterium]
MTLSKDRLQSLTDRSTDIVVATTVEGKVGYYNDGAERGLGYTPDEIMGVHVSRLYSTLEEAKRVMAAMRSEAHGGKGIIETFETRFMSKDGEEIPVAISGTIIYNDDGKEDGTIGYAKDLRDILHRDQLATLGEVAIGLSHEINNPLAVILNQAELLEDEVYTLAQEQDTSVETERLDAIRREVGRIAEILERLGQMVESDTYETVNYIGPARMVDLKSRHDAESAASRWRERLGGTHILVVDDDTGICHSLQEILVNSGCTVETANDGVEAMECVAAGEFDLLLTDVVMPRMDGHELYLTLKEQRPDLPVLMMTAFHYDKDHIIKRSRMKGLEGVIFKKPLDPDRLREVICETLGR